MTSQETEFPHLKSKCELDLKTSTLRTIEETKNLTIPTIEEARNLTFNSLSKIHMSSLPEVMKFGILVGRFVRTSKYLISLSKFSIHSSLQENDFSKLFGKLFLFIIMKIFLPMVGFYDLSMRRFRDFYI